MNTAETSSARQERILFVTGRLAENALRRVVEPLAKKLGFGFQIQVMPISVAALLTAEWIRPRIDLSSATDRIVLPGYCRGDLASLSRELGVHVELGPRDLRRLPEHFGQRQELDESYGESNIEIIAEINHAPQMALDRLVATAEALRSQGADTIDIGCEPGAKWEGVAEAVAAVKSLGVRVSVDTLDADEIRAAVGAGADLVLSMNSSNRHLAEELDVEWVIIPDLPSDLQGLDPTVEHVAKVGGRFRIDPILEPIGMGFSTSLGRYLETRRRYPDAAMMMGIGNLTELTDVDSAGINAMLLGFCQEQAIHSVLTTQVISWAQSSVKECSIARELMHYAVTHGVPPKRLDSRLVMLRDPKVTESSVVDLAELAGQLKDNNYRMFKAEGELHLIASKLHLRGQDPFELFDQLMETQPKNVDPSHAFYLGFELCKAYTALTLGKEYRQDEAISWGHLTVEEKDRHRLQRRRRSQGTQQ